MGWPALNDLLSIVNDQDQKWVIQFPPMPTKRSHTAVVSTKEHLIVAGGGSGWIRLDKVEVLDIETLVWSTAASLPHPYFQASATICGDQLYMLGGLDNYGHSKSVLTCSLTKLLQTCSERLPDLVWHKIADIPVYHSTCAAVNGELVAVGGVGMHTKLKTTAAVYKYNLPANSWSTSVISNMPTARQLCLLAVLPTNEIMVVGGYPDLGSGVSSGCTDEINIADTN